MNVASSASSSTGPSPPRFKVGVRDARLRQLIDVKAGGKSVSRRAMDAFAQVGHYVLSQIAQEVPFHAGKPGVLPGRVVALPMVTAAASVCRRWSRKPRCPGIAARLVRRSKRAFHRLVLSREQAKKDLKLRIEELAAELAQKEQAATDASAAAQRDERWAEAAAEAEKQLAACKKLLEQAQTRLSTELDQQFERRRQIIGQHFAHLRGVVDSAFGEQVNSDGTTVDRTIELDATAIAQEVEDDPATFAAAAKKPARTAAQQVQYAKLRDEFIAKFGKNKLTGLPEALIVESLQTGRIVRPKRTKASNEDGAATPAGEAAADNWLD